MAFTVTPAHADIFHAITDPNGGNLIIEAVAGAGKTSTIVHALGLIPPGTSVMFLAFGKKIVEDLSRKVPPGVHVSTLSSLGHRALMKYVRDTHGFTPKIEDNKVRTLAQEPGVFVNAVEKSKYMSPALRLVRLAKSSGMIPDGCGTALPGLVPDTATTWLDLAEHHDVDIGENGDINRVVEIARELMSASCRTLNVMDFDDQLLMSYALNAPMPRGDIVFVDEAQDLSPLQHAMLRRVLGKAGRVVAVGDPYQSIFGFRGADSESMRTLSTTFGCRSLPLHVSYRCSKSVVRVAQQFVPHIRPHDDAPEGEAHTDPVPLDKAGIRVGDMVVCRTSAPTVKVAHWLLRQGVPAIVVGKNIGGSLLSLLNSLKATTLDDADAKLTRWENREIEKAAKKDDEARAAAATDRADTLRVFLDMATDLDDLANRINAMFANAEDTDPNAVVSCSTIHKAKGLEADRVHVVNTHKMPSKWAKQEWQVVQENNLFYVAVTRAKSFLQYVVVDDNRNALPASSRERMAPNATADVLVTGNTYAVKDLLKSLGARWNPEAKGWMVPADRAEEARRAVASAPRAPYRPRR